MRDPIRGSLFLFNQRHRVKGVLLLLPESTSMELMVHTALHELKRKVPYHWDLNIYRGCAHGCRYCYARSSHQYLGESDFQEVLVKANLLEVLEAELATFEPREIINIGGVTDAYQPIEAERKLMPEVLSLLIKYRIPAIISTKSDLILRDYDLIAELAALTYVNVAQSITTMDDTVQRVLEPGAASPEKRFKALAAFADTRASTGLHLMPIIPWLTDGQVNLEQIISAASTAQVSYALTGTLYFTRATRAHFFAFLQEHFPEAVQGFTYLYPTNGVLKEYKEPLYARIHALRQKYGVTSDYTAPIKARLARSPRGTYCQL